MSAGTPSDERNTLDEALESLREAGRPIRTVKNRMRADGMREIADYRDLGVRLATALAMTEASHAEAQRHLKRLEGGGRR